MKIIYKTKNDRISAELEGETQRDLFEQVSSFQEVFGESCCGRPDCKSENLKFVVRNVDDNQFYELKCEDCYAKLQFGAHKKGGGLFPKRKEGDTYLPHNGWVKWDKDSKTYV